MEKEEIKIDIYIGEGRRRRRDGWRVEEHLSLYVTPYYTTVQMLHL
jgi:hypothetical protein